VLSKSFLLIRDFLVNELKEKPVEVLGGDCWEILLNNADVYNKEKKKCIDSLSKIKWVYDIVEGVVKELFCPECNSELIFAPEHDKEYPDIHLTCLSCKHVFNFIDVAEDCIHSYFSFEHYLSFTDGAKSPYEYCADCQKNTYISDEMCCIVCGYSEGGYGKCNRCGIDFDSDDPGLDNLCSFCHASEN